MAVLLGVGEQRRLCVGAEEAENGEDPHDVPQTTPAATWKTEGHGDPSEDHYRRKSPENLFQLQPPPGDEVSVTAEAERTAPAIARR